MKAIHRMYKELLKSNVQLPKDELKKLACQLSKVETGLSEDVDYYAKAGEFLQSQIDSDVFMDNMYLFFKDKDWNKTERRYFMDCVTKQLELVHLMGFLKNENNF